MSDWSFEQQEPGVATLSLNGPTGRILFLADLHWDNVLCDRELLAEDIKRAASLGAPVFIVGDLFCAMQGKWDKRADQNQLREEHRGNRYLDNLVDTAAEWFLPYADAIAAITMGNHETSIIGRHQTNLLDRLASTIRGMGGPQIPVMAYRTFVRASVKPWNSEQMKTFDILLHHGYGGGGEVTRGMIDNNRTRSAYFANVYVSGHIHRRNTDENVIERITKTIPFRIEQVAQLFIRCGSYKRDAQPDGWHTETGKGPRPMGGYWLEWQYSDVRIEGGHRRVELELRAIAT